MRIYKYYEESLKREVVREVKSGLLSQEEARRKYGIRGSSTILGWIRKFDDSNQTRNEMSHNEKTPKELLLQRIKELERQLEDEKLRSEGLSKMIDIAEDQLDIEIRKKLDTKRSKR